MAFNRSESDTATEVSGLTATTAELNYLDVSTLGTAENSKAFTRDDSGGATFAGTTFTDLGTVTTCDINGGTIDGVTIGATVAPTITNCDMNGGTIDGVAIGATTSAAGTFTSLNSNGISDSGTTTALSITSSEIVSIHSDQVRVLSSKTPSSASDTGTTGAICWDSSYIYVCVATDTWKRVAIATW